MRLQLDQLLYDAQPGDYLPTVTAWVLEMKLAGFVFNEVIVRVETGDTAQTLMTRYEHTMSVLPNG